MRPRALKSFTVKAQLPPPLSALHDIAMNLRWSWDAHSRDLFRWVDPTGWEESGYDPIHLLATVGRERLDALANDQAFTEFLAEVDDDLKRYGEAPRWFQKRTSPLSSVAYFSPEFGISEALPQYSGGLGVLAGDHLKAASGLGVPIVGVGLFYHQGYFRQGLDADGWQEERYVQLDPHAMALSLVDAQIKIDLAGMPLVARIWKAQVGRIPLYLLDTDVEENTEDGRSITDRLYSGGEHHRIQQEVLLGIGGVHALDALGLLPQVFHMNEGHAGFLALERIRRFMTSDGLSLPEAVESVRASTAFTTHTPVPAGIDLFSHELMKQHFGGFAEECGIAFDDVMQLGHYDGDPHDAPFNMAVMCLRLSGQANGVSKLHGRVSRNMFGRLWPQVPEDEVPIKSVTNGIHSRTWVAPGMAELFDRYVLPEWNEADAERWSRINGARDDEIWRVRENGREQLVAFIRKRLRETGRAGGVNDLDLEWCDDVLDPRILTIGFARRFAAYKRPTMLLSQPDRLKAILLSQDHPVQLVFAGKAHPADDMGKQMIRQIVQFSRDPAIRHRIAFIEDFDIGVSRMFYQGCDVWLNTPRRPLEACGTSGEKAALSGVLNLSTLDGWWDEMFDGQNGWAISSAENYTDLAHRDEREAASLFELLERHIIPLFYERTDSSSTPHRWVSRIKASLASLGPKAGASRMVRDYVELIYEPLADRSTDMVADRHARARSLAQWKDKVKQGWAAVNINSVDSDTTSTSLGVSREVTAVVNLGSLDDSDIEVQLVHGPVGTGDELYDTTLTTMALVGHKSGGGSHRYQGAFSCETAGRYGFTVRVVPAHDDIFSHTELGCITWA
ncbi:MAG: alpha-glucan family phosphorylase [Actinomycetota bacterium]